MNLNRVWAMVLRYVCNMRHSLDRLSDMFYWPAIDLFVWGLTGLYLAQLISKSHQYLFVILSGLVFWLIIWRAQYEITISLLSEFWDRNIVNLFTTPLTLTEMMVSFMIFGFLKTIGSLAFSASLAYLLYGYNVFYFGWNLVLFFISLMLTGWAVGFLVGAVLVRYGQKFQAIGWAGVALISPFSAIYYPVSVLPVWAQKVSALIPSTYIFEAIREMLFTHHVSYDKILISFGLNLVYLTLAIVFFRHMFDKSRKLGLGRLV